jgi:ATP-binding cassette subfamily B protein RaxB
MSLRDRIRSGSARLPMVLQTEASECGLACVAMLLGYHGRPTDLAELRRRYGPSLRGATLKDLLRVCDQLGLATRPLRLELEEMPRLSTPCILHWDLHHFVVLKGWSRGRAILHDPDVGVRRLGRAEVARHFTGVALELFPTGDFVPAAPPRLQLGALVGRVDGLRRPLMQLALLALAIELFALVGPLFLQGVVDHALVDGDRDLLLTLALGFALLVIIKTALSTMRGWMLIALGASLEAQGRANLFSHLIDLPASYFASRHLGDVVARWSAQETLLQAIAPELLAAILDGLLAVVTLVIMMLFAPDLAALVVLGALVYGGVRGAAHTALKQAAAESIAWAARRDIHLQETLRGIETIKLFDGPTRRRGRWFELMVETVHRQLSSRKLQLGLRSTSALCVGAVGILVVWQGARHVLDNRFSVGMLLAFIAYKDQFLECVSTLVDKGLDLYLLRLHGERLADIALTAPEPRRRPDDDDEPRARTAAALELSQLRFRYGDNDPWLLDGVDLRIDAGESVAIVGESGCGKTTLIKLLASLLAPSDGCILVDGQPLLQLGVGRYRSMIGVVLQNDQLFSGSIADNISFFAGAPDLRRVEACAQVAALHADVMAMPLGYNTLVGDMGSVLSGGQKQQLLLARALYRQPRLLLLDEATCHIDVAREQAIFSALRAIAVTRVIVAHRPETIRAADRVITLAGGRAVSDVRADRAVTNGRQIG